VLRHDSICDLIQTELERRGFHTLDHLEYKTDTACGELDVVAYKPGYTRAILVEVKYNHNYKNQKKAISQMKRAEEYCPFLQQFKNITKLYVYHTRNTYKIEQYNK
jgi:hypothetical protein